MGDKSIKKIVCAVRGHPQGRDTASRAIELALQYGAQLTFVLVLDAEYLGIPTPVMTPLRTVYRQLEEMGEFAMLILVDRALRRGLQNVGYSVLKGEVKDELRKLTKTTDADMLVLGRPDPNVRKSIFEPAEFDQFITDLQVQTGVHIVPVASGAAK